jgi:hypothetical protein
MKHEYIFNDLYSPLSTRNSGKTYYRRRLKSKVDDDILARDLVYQTVRQICHVF